MDFQGKVVLVTGASKGIGAAIAEGFAAEKATVIINYLQDSKSAEEVAARCHAKGGHAWTMQGDVTSLTAAHSMIKQIIEEAGRLDILVNNAFHTYMFDPEQRKLATQLRWEDYESQLHGSLKGVYNMCRAALPHMMQRCSGKVINIVTNLVANPIVPYHDYTTAKAAVMGYSRNLAAEAGSYGVTVNCVAPGLVYPTQASQLTKEELKEQIIAQTPLRRIAAPEDIAGPVMFLASDWSRFMTGQTLYVDGGLVMK